MINSDVRSIVLFEAKDGATLQSAETRPGADYGSDHELLTAKSGLKLKSIGKTTGLFMYDLNQIPSDYKVEVTKRFKGLDLVD